jgi:hypothetical protein
MAESIRPGSSTEVAKKVGKDLGGIAFLKTLGTETLMEDLLAESRAVWSTP